MKRLASLIIIFLASVSLAQGTPQNSQRAEQLYREAVAKADRNDVEGAIRDLSEAISLDRTMDKAYWKRGELYDRQNQQEKSREDIKRARSLRAFKTGMELIQKNDFAGAIRSFGQVVEGDPDFHEAYYQRGLLYGADGDYGRAVSDLTNAIRLNPDHDDAQYVDAHYFRGLFNLEKGNLPDAVADLRRTVELNEDYVDAYVSLGDVYLKQKNFAEAEQVYKEALSRKNDDPDVLNGLGYALIKLNRAIEALTPLKRADSLKRNDPQIISNLGLAQFEAGHLEPAKVYLERARSMNSENPEVWDKLGDIYKRLGQTEEAQKHWRKATTLLPDTEVAQKRVLSDKINNLSATSSRDAGVASVVNPQQASASTQANKGDSTPANRQNSDGRAKTGQREETSTQGKSGPPSGGRPAGNVERENPGSLTDDASVRNNQGVNNPRTGGDRASTNAERDGAAGQLNRPPVNDGRPPLADSGANPLTNLNSAALENNLKTDLGATIAAFNQGKEFQRKRDWEGAEKSFKKAHMSLPKKHSNLLLEASILNELGYTLTQRGRFDDAYGHLLEAHGLNPEDPKILDRLGDVLYRQGQRAEDNSDQQKAADYFKDAQSRWNVAIQIMGDAEQRKKVQDKLKDVDKKLRGLNRQ